MSSRRTFLRHVGLAAASLPFFKSLEASADETPPPLRFVGLYHPHAASSPLYTMRPGETETTFDLSYPNCVLSPFDDAATYGRSFKDKLLILEGVDLVGAIESGSAGHAAPSCILTGTGGQPNHASIDQFLAVERKLGASTRLTSLVLGVGYDGVEANNSISFGVGGAPQSKIISPRKTFDALFTGLANAGDTAAQQKAERERQKGQSVLDFIKGDVTRLRGRLAAREQVKLDQHLTAIRELEKRVTAVPPATGCTVPAKPTDPPRLGAYNGGEPYFDLITNLQIDLLAQAMACDVTRFATLWTNDLSRGAATAAGLTGLPDDCHGDLAHKYSGPHDSHFGGNAFAGDPATWAALGVQNRYSYGKAARLLQRFNEFGMLDQVMVLMSGDMGDPNGHSSRNVPMVIAGGCGGKFRMGRRLKQVNDCPPDRYYCDPPTLVSNNKILVSIAHAFGQTDVTSFGTTTKAADSQGDFAGLV